MTVWTEIDLGIAGLPREFRYVAQRTRGAWWVRVGRIPYTGEWTVAMGCGPKRRRHLVGFRSQAAAMAAGDRVLERVAR